MPKPTLVSLAVAAILEAKGEQLRPRRLAEILLARNPDHFERKKREYEAQNPGKSVAYQIEREIYARRYAIVEGAKRIQVDISDGISFFAAPEAEPELPTVATAEPPTVTEIDVAASSVVDVLKQNAAASELPEDTIREAALYPVLLDYLAEAESTLGMRINESRSSNKRGRNGNKWLHPDLVGMIVPELRWSRVVKECSRLLPTRRAKLVSVEVKVRITSSDIREAFFQTVSNSQWANRAYLAATQVQGRDTWRELEMLCSLHGVGYIRVDPDDPQNGRILIPAREREEVDWASANRIAEENEDFRKYLQAVLNYLNSGEVVPQLWHGTPGAQKQALAGEAFG